MRDYLLSGYWAATGGPASSFDTSGSNQVTYDVSGLTPEGQQLVLWALGAWEMVADLDFDAASSGADITFRDDQPGAFSTYITSGGNTQSAEVNISTGWIANEGTRIGDYGLQTYIHEIGHALGLGHMGPYDGGGTSYDDAIFTNDSWQLSVMSYIWQTANPTVTASYAELVTPMTVDILAAQALYGASTETAGDTVWGAGSTVDGLLGTLFAALYDGGPGADVAPGALAMTIYDHGGHDTIDVSPSNAAQRITLVGGQASDLEGYTGNLLIMPGTVIEDLFTGAGNDALTGNAAGNLLDAGGGNDTLQGGAGNDTLIGGAGNDRAVWDVQQSAATISVSGNGFLVGIGAEIDYVEGVETFAFLDGSLDAGDLVGTPSTVIGTEGNDILAGDTGPDALYGYLGNDFLDGLEGSDTLYGGAGNDSLLGRTGNDVVYGGSDHDNIALHDGDDYAEGGLGSDSLGGGVGNDTLYGGAGNDELGGGFGDDYIDAGADRDAASGGPGSDIVLGNDGNDTLAGSYDDDTVEGGAGNDALGGGFGNDQLRGGAGNDGLGGGEGDDILQGASGNDFLGGAAGQDLLLGGGGEDTLNGGTGDDMLVGGDGADLFVFNALMSGESDLITDFEDGSDQIRIRGGSFALLDISDTAEGALVSIAGHDILLENVVAADLDASDFLFV
ncbi:MAG: M10 family metallopeptidase [Paracoccaceae bacterium]